MPVREDYVNLMSSLENLSAVFDILSPTNNNLGSCNSYTPEEFHDFKEELRSSGNIQHSSFSIIHFNCRSLRANYDKFNVCSFEP